MKILKLTLALLVCMLLGCENDSSSTNSSQSETGKSGSLARFTMLGDYLYAVDEQNLNIFNISNNENPVLVNSVFIGFDIETLSSYDGYLYIGSRNGMFIYSTTNSEEPALLSQVQHFTACDPVIANETHAYVTLKGGNLCGTNLNLLEVYDIENVENPILISSRNLVSPVGLSFYQNYLIVCDDEVKIFDISDVTNINLVHSINEYAFDVIIQDNLMLLIGSQGLYQFSLDPSNIQNTAALSSIVF